MPMARGFVYLAVVLDWFSRRVLSWRVTITMEAAFCVETPHDAMARQSKNRSRIQSTPVPCALDIWRFRARVRPRAQLINHCFQVSRSLTQGGSKLRIGSRLGALEKRLCLTREILPAYHHDVPILTHANSITQEGSILFRQHCDKLNLRLKSHCHRIGACLLNALRTFGSCLGPGCVKNADVCG